MLAPLPADINHTTAEMQPITIAHKLAYTAAQQVIPASSPLPNPLITLLQEITIISLV